MIWQRLAFLVWLLLLQYFATFSAATAREPTRWQADIDAFAAADHRELPVAGGVVFVGSSSIRLWDLENSFPGKGVLNRGFGGSEIRDATHYFDELVAKHEPRLVVLYAGDNDIAAGNSAERVLADFREFVGKFQANLLDARLVFISIKPSIARWKLADTMRAANALIAADCAADEHLDFVDVWPVMLGANGEPKPEIFREDGLHMNEQGYVLWAELLWPHLTE